MTGDPVQEIEHDVDRVVGKAVRADGDRRFPKFYALSGSHIYGFASDADDGGDYDVRGFHTVPAERWANLDEPKEQIIINQGTTTQGYEAWADVDFVSYEIKKFGSLLDQGNFNVLELVFDGPQLVNGCPLEINALKDLVREHLPMDVPYHYRGMATSNYKRYLDPEKDNYTPSAKKFLYVIRGLLGATYTHEHEDIEPDVRELAIQVGTDGSLETVERLIEVKLEGETAMVEDDELREEADRLCSVLFNHAPAPDGGDVWDHQAYRGDLDAWMQKVRS